jgi:hypothetical protein
MEAAKVRRVREGGEFTRFFPKAELKDTIVKKNADLQDTMQKIPEVVKRYGYQAKHISEYLKRETVYETCKSIWHWVYNHIAYKKDETGYEQLRTPARAFHDRKTGVDCDCYSIFISSVLQHLEIPHLLRITKYGNDHFQHIYPVVLLPDGKQVTMDCVVEAFDFETPFTEKKDYTMELQILSGLDNEAGSTAYNDSDGMGALGKIIQKRFAQGQQKPPAKKTFIPTKKTNPAIRSQAPDKKQKGKVINKVNRLNPTTVTMRNGILASMKLNISNVAGRLRWSYLSEQEALRQGIAPDKFSQLRSVRQRLEDIYYKTGGKPENLRQAILKGKGNSNKAVNGLEGNGESTEYLNEYYPLRELLGDEVYHSENVQGMEGFAGFGSLGEPVTLATIAAASGVIAGIAGMLKQVGDIFSKKTKGSEDFDAAKNEQAEKENPAPAALPATPPVNNNENGGYVKPANNNHDPQTYAAAAPVYPPDEKAVTKAKDDEQKKETEQNDLVRAGDGEQKKDAEQNNLVKTGDGQKDPDDKSGFWERSKGWVVPVGIGAAILTILAVIVAASNKKKQKQPPRPAKALSGVPKKNHHRKTKQRKKPALKATVLL